jgi:PIN domain nuclease of toxin-antitoxin system
MFVIDASALVALLRDEPGAEVVEERLAQLGPEFGPAARISTVNLAEIHQLLGSRLPQGLVGDTDGIVECVDFTVAHAREAASLHAKTRKAGLSLADRACLALAKVQRLPVLTADRGWAGIEVGVKVELIR